MEGRGTFQGTPTPPEPAPEIPLEDQGTLREWGKTEKIRPPGVKDDSDRFKIKFSNQTNHSSNSLLSGRDTWTPARQGGGEAEGGGVQASRTLLLEQNKK